jgi:membrane protein DedA with SNARE-associated domain
MFDKILNPLVQIFLGLGQNYGYLAVFAGALADSLIPIVPSEIVFGSAGYWAYKGYINLPVAVIIAVIGNLIASAIFWYLGKQYGHNFLLKWGKYLGFGTKEMNRSEKVFAKWGYLSVFVCQFIPLFRSLISIPSGVLELEFKKFIVATALGAAVWNAALMIFAYNLGENWEQIGTTLTTFGKPITIIFGFGLLLVAGYYGYKLYKNKYKSAKL